MKASKKAIESFLSAKKIAIAGVSRNSKKFGHTVFKELSQKGFDIYPINPNTESIDGVPCFSSVSSLPSGIDHLLVVTPKKNTTEVVRESIRKGIRNIWIQQMSETPEALEESRQNNVNLIYKQCILMWSEPVEGFHKFHRSVKKFFGLLPR